MRDGGPRSWPLGRAALASARLGSAPCPTEPATSVRAPRWRSPTASFADPSLDGSSGRGTVTRRLPCRDPRARLVLVNGSDPAALGTSFAVTPAGFLVGRGLDADVRVEDPGVSRRHLRLRRGPAGDFAFEDLGSTNGTYLNGVQAAAGVLSEGDRLQLGVVTELRLVLDPRAAQSEIRLRRATSVASAGAWEWFADRGALRLSGGFVHGLLEESGATRRSRDDDWGLVHPDDRDALLSGVCACLERPGPFMQEVRFRRARGGTAWAVLTGEAFHDRQAMPVRVAGTMVDVTQRRFADPELRRQASLFESLADAVLVVGADGAAIDWSSGAERLFGWTKAEAVARRPGVLLEAGESQAADGERLEQALLACVRAGERLTGVFELRSRDGQEVPVEVRCVPHTSADGALRMAVAGFRDLREQRRLQGRLTVAERLVCLGNVSAGLAHEINNPLAFISSSLEYLSEQLDEVKEGLGPRHAEMRQAFDDCRQGTDRIAGVVREFGNLALSDDRLASSTTDANATVEYALRIAERHLQGQVRVVRDLEAAPRVVGSEARIGQVFLHLLVNVAQAVAGDRDREGVVRVSSCHDAERGRVIVEIADAGPGLAAPDVQARRFEPFVSSRPTGIGKELGLYLCQMVVTALGGELAVESAPQVATTFRVFLPVARDEGRSPRT